MFPKLTPVTKNIIILCAVVYLITNLVNTDYLYAMLSAFYPFSPNFRSWQVVTHMFMHAPFNDSSGIGVMHILFNMLTLWSFGPVLEQVLGSKKFAILYFASGLGAFVLFNVWNFYEVHQLTSALTSEGVNIADIFRKSALNYHGDMSIFKENENALELGYLLNSKMLGASGAIFGVVAAFSTMFPDAKLMFMFIPFPIKAKYLLPIIIVISLYLQFSGNMGGIAHLAHIGGAIIGFFLARKWRNNKFRIQ